jgi:hypothetical protein
MKKTKPLVLKVELVKQLVNTDLQQVAGGRRRSSGMQGDGDTICRNTNGN